MSLFESDIEKAACEWFEDIGYTIAHGPDIAPEGSEPERESFEDVVLHERLRNAIALLNPGIPLDGLEEAFRKVTRLTAPTLVGRNRQIHKWIRDGVDVEFRRPDGSIGGDQVRLVDAVDVEQNDFLVVNQFFVRESNNKRIPDIVVFVNGLPIAVIELKSMADEDATIDQAFQQIKTYKAEIPRLFDYNELLVVSDGGAARMGSLTAGWECSSHGQQSTTKRPSKASWHWRH